MNEKEYKEILKGLEKANESVVPFPINTDEELIVAGDANQTQLNRHDFSIRFRIPNEDGTYSTHKKEYKGVYITPRQNSMIVKALTALYPYFKKPLESGEVSEYEEEELKSIREKFNEGIYDIMYDLVAAVLKIDEDLKDYMIPFDVETATAKIIYQYPELVNEADTFFG